MAQSNYSTEKNWWQKPGFGIMYQIEARPGWHWNRNYDKFNRSMMDDKGNLNFNGPFCKMEKWVEFSKKVGVDYHIFEAKWHDGICYFDSKYTNWKTQVDYCKIFAEESKKYGIPFMWYYSSIFDHNPQFDDIQPQRTITPSFIALHEDNKEEIQKFSISFWRLLKKMFMKDVKERAIPYGDGVLEDIEEHDFIYNPEKYEQYLINQIEELIEIYQVDGMWMDWFWDDMSTVLVMDLLEKKYPHVVLTYNVSIDRRVRYAHYLSGEAHDVNTAWKSGNKHRRKKKPWELCGPAAHAWDVPIARPDPYEIFRIAAIILASGGKYVFGLPSRMDGEIYPEPAHNVVMFGEWYGKRKTLFTDAVPMDYKSKQVPGVKVNDPNFGVIGNLYGSDYLLHIINFLGKTNDIVLTLTFEQWKNVSRIILEPSKKELKFKNTESEIVLSLTSSEIDLTDTILRLVMKD